jgi:voltage-gated potassium channel
MKRPLKKRIFYILDATIEGGKVGRAFNGFIMLLIVINVGFVILETIKGVSSRYQEFIDLFETFSVLIFTAEYLLRLWTCTIDIRYKNPVWGRIKFIFSPLILIDLMAILPFYIPMIIPLDLIFLRALRLFRVFRIFKMARYSASLKLFGSVIKSKKEELVISFAIMIVLLIFSATLIHYAEHQAQPEQFSSIPDSMWWAASTFTTIGYGDAIPITPFGKILSLLLSFLGIGIFALPAGILASGFIDEMHKKRHGKRICPHCGKPYE